jgi:hypothetical protein
MFALRLGDVTSKWVDWTIIGIALLSVVLLLMALGYVYWEIAMWYLDPYRD